MPPPRRQSGYIYNAGPGDPQTAMAAAVASHGPLARVRGWLRKLYHLKTEHQFLGRYSIEKLEAFHDYQAHARWYRVAFVVLATPLPTLLVLLAMDAVPMEDPRAGARRNVVCFVRSVLSHGVMTAVCLLPARQALQLHASGNYSVGKIVLIGLLTCIAIESVWIPTAFAWRFPVPFRELLGVPLWCAVVVLLHCWLAPRVFSRRPRRTRTYLFVVSTQITILYGFLALSLGFAHVPIAAQVVMIACFPFVKVAVKRFVWTYARQLDDISTDVTICMVEVSGSLYQTVCLQFAKSPVIGAVILFTDFAQALVEVRAYLATDYLVDGRATLATAMAILQSSVFPGADERPSLLHYSSTASMASQAENASASRRHSGTGSVNNGVTIRRRRRKPVVGSVFMQPKLITKHASKRLMDLKHIDFDLLDFSPPSGPQVQPAIADPIIDPAIDDEAGHPPPRSPSPKDISSLSVPCGSASPDVTVDLVMTEGLLPPAAAEPGVSRPVQMPQVPPTVASIRIPSRTALHTDFSLDTQAVLTPSLTVADTPVVRPPAGPPTPPPLVRKSSSSSSGFLERSSRLLKRLSLHRKLSDSSTHPEPSNQASDTPAGIPRTHQLARIVPASVSPPSPPPAIASQHSNPPTARPSSRHASLPSTRQHSLVTAAHASMQQPFGRTQSFDRRRRSSDAGVGNGAVTIDGVQIARKEQARILEQTLQLLFSCEVLVFVEYMEVVMPVLYALCIGTEWTLPNGKYNLITMRMDLDAIVSAVGGSVLYAILELASLVVLNMVVWRKYGVSAVHLLAFILETYVLTLQGKLVGAFIVIINTATLHQGVDFTFRFDYDQLLGPRSSPHAS